MRRTAAPASPNAPVLGAGVLLAAVLALVAMNRPAAPGAGPAPILEQGTALASRDLRFADRPDGGVSVTEAGSGAVVAVLAPGQDGFIRATLRGLVRERRRDALGPETPFRLTRWDDGRVTLRDPATGHNLDLRAFGSTNLGAFARLLGTEEATR